MNKKYLSLILALIIVGSTFNIVNAAQTNNAKIDWLVDNGIVKGDEGSGNLRLNDTITRAEASAMIVRVKGLETLATGFKATKSQFKDVQTNHWANGYINVVASNGVVNGYPDGTFKPEDKITYSEIIKMLVIVNGDLPVENLSVSWEVPYITKALEVGILDEINIELYSNKAIRQKMFEMVYNLMSKDSATGLETYKGIVIENKRTSGLNKNEIAIEVIERNSNAANYRYEKGSNVRIKLLKVKEDTDYLLGKVIDVAITESNEASRITIDNSYTYMTGEILLKNSELTINGKTYGVRDINKYAYELDKLVAVYHNDKEYLNFKDYFNKVGKSKDFKSDFSNVTLKGNSVLFIDSFIFEDIALVKESFDSEEVFQIYRDDINGSLGRFVPTTVIGFDANGFKSLELKNIKANDVVHIYDRDKAIVRTDAVISTTFERYKEVSNSNYIEIDKENIFFVDSYKRRPIYSLDGIRFFTLFGSRGDLDLDPLRGQRVSIILDVNNKLQSIVGNIKYDEGVFIIEDTTKRSANVIGPHNGSSTVVVEGYSVLNFLGSDINKTINDFTRGDLVYLMKEDSRIEKMVRMDTGANINSKSKLVAKSVKGSFEINKSWIVVDELRSLTSNFEINNANIYIMKVDGNKIPTIIGTTLEYVIENAKPNSDLKAYIISNKDFYIMNLGNNIKYGNEANVAHTIVFTNFENKNINLKKEVMRVTYKFIPGRDNIIEGKDIYGTTITRKVGKNLNLPELIPGDIIELGIDKDKIVVESMIMIPKNAVIFKVIEIDGYSSNRARKVVLEDSKKVKKEHYILKDALEFIEVEEGSKVSVNFNLDGDIDILIKR